MKMRQLSMSMNTRIYTVFFVLTFMFCFYVNIVTACGGRLCGVCEEDPGGDTDEEPKLNLNNKQAFILGLKLTNIRQGKMRENLNLHWANFNYDFKL